MNPILIGILVILFLLGLFALAAIAPRFMCSKRLIACNIAEGVHERCITKLPDAAIATRFLLYKPGSDADHIAVNGAADMPWGTVDDECSAAELASGNHFLNVNLLGKGPTKRMVASEAIALTDEIFTAANGKIQNRPAGAGTYWYLGRPVTIAGADNDIIEVQDCVPVKVVIP